MAPEPSGGAPPQRALPTGKLLTHLLELADEEAIVNARGNRSDAPRGYPVLERLWTHAEAISDLRRETDPTDRASMIMEETWTALDEEFGPPVGRAWVVPPSEGHDRWRAVLRFFYRTRSLDPANTEGEAPENFLASEEVQGT